MAQRNPRLIGGVYQVGQVLTTGPLLTSYTAYNRNTSDVVGLLVMELPTTFDPLHAEQILRVLERRRAIQSQHVIHVHDWGIYDGKAYIATDPPRGITLRHVLDTENIDLHRALDLTIQIARGLVTLQSQGIVDTDLRPQLITIDTVGVDDRAQLDDVGLRSLLKQLGYVASDSPSDIGYLDPRYAAPESIYQGRVGPASDVYQLGLVLYELVTGRPPFVGRNAAETGIMQSTSAIPPMSQFEHTTPQELQDLVSKALAKDPVQRFANAGAMLTALERLTLPPRRGTTGEWNALAAVAAQPTIKPGEPPSGPSTGPRANNVGLTNEMAPVNVRGEDTLVDGEATMHRSQSSGSLLSDEGVIAYLTFEKEGAAPQKFPIKNNYIIVGRLDPKRGLVPEIDLSGVDPTMTVSRQHARIRYEKTFFYIEDLKSRNKTRLGELTLIPLKPELLQHGDVVHFGSVRLVFRVPGANDPPVINPL